MTVEEQTLPPFVAGRYFIDGTEGTLADKVDKDSVVVAASRLVQSKLLVTDAQPAFKINGLGTIAWGPGGSAALDTTLYRGGADMVLTDDAFWASGNIVANLATASQIWLHSNGRLYFHNTTDVSLYRPAAGTLGTDNLFHVSNGSWLATNNGNNNQPQIEFAYAGAYRSYRHSIQTNHHGGLDAGNTIEFFLWTTSVASDALPTFRALKVQGDGKLIIGNSDDTNLYRLSPNFLVTDDAFCVNYNTVGQLYFNAAGQIVWDNAQDTKLYRNAAGSLRTDGSFTTGGQLNVTGGIICGGTLYISTSLSIDSNTPYFTKTAALQLTSNASLIMSGGINTALDSQFATAMGGGGITIGSTGGKYGINIIDTNLYRSAAGVLQTDGYFNAGGYFRANNGTANGVIVGYVNSAVGRGISFINDAQSAWDTNLYRSAADTLKTDDSFIAAFGIATLGGNMYLQHNSTPAIYFGAANDVNLYRLSSSVLKTDDSFETAGDLYFGNGIYFTNNAGRAFCNAPIAAHGISCQAGQDASPLGNKYTIYWDGAAHLYIDTTYIGAFAWQSDVRNKQMITSMKSSWETVKAMNPVNFRWRDRGVFADDGKNHVGFLAQEVQELIPSGVTSPSDDPEQPLALQIPAILATVTKALQEAMARIEKLEAA